MNFDHTTAYLITGALYIMVPGLVWVLLRDQKLKETVWWCGGGMIIGVGTLWTTLLNNIIPTPLYGAGAAFLIFWGVHLKIRVLRSFLLRPYSKRFWMAFAFIYLFVEVFIDMLWGHQFRGAFFVFTHSIMYGYLAYLGWRIHVKLKSRSILWIFGSYLTVTLLLPFLLFSSAFVNPGIWRVGTPAAVLVVVGILILFINHIAYMGLLIENAISFSELTKNNVRSLNLQSFFGKIFMLTERERILANVSRKLVHEINQPLSSMNYMLSMMRRARRDKRFEELDLDDLLERMNINILLANGVVNQIRPLAKLGKAQIELIDLRRLINEAIIIVNADVNSICINSPSLDSSALMVNGVRIELLQVLVNLLRNALQACVKYDVKPSIELEIGVSGGEVCLIIKDNGPGLSEQALRDAGRVIFTDQTNGMGLGLWICQDILANHSGHLILCNRDDAHSGCQVTIVLPRPLRRDREGI